MNIECEDEPHMRDSQRSRLFEALLADALAPAARERRVTH
jgi:hypothetical protein